MIYRLINADVRSGLASLPAESIQTVITSPPYWGLRDYGIEPSVWGGDPSCEHAWGDAVRTAWANSVQGPNGKGGKNAGGYRIDAKWTGPFCQSCGAWRGVFGLEPTPELYVEHAVLIFREVWRVLRKDGTLWLNLGDSYAGGGNGGGGSFAKDGIRCALPGTDKNKATRFGNRGVSNGLKAKDLVGIPWMVAFALRADGWYLRADIVWNKPNPMPESVTDRPTKAHEYLFLLAKSERYLYDAEAIKERASEITPSKMPDGWNTAEGAHGSFHPNGREKGRRTDKQRGHTRRHAGFNDRRDQTERSEQCSGKRNKRSVWAIATQPFPEAHFATFPEALVEPCVLAGSRLGDTVLDPFSGSGTTGVVALAHQRDYIGIELNSEYAEMSRRRLEAVAPMFATEVR